MFLSALPSVGATVVPHFLPQGGDTLRRKLLEEGVQLVAVIKRLLSPGAEDAVDGIVKKTAHSIARSGRLSTSLLPPCTLDERRQIFLVGGVTPEAVIVGFDPAKDALPHLFSLHGGAVYPIYYFFFERSKKALHMNTVKATVCTPHTLPDRSVSGKHRAIFSAGILAAVIRVQDHPRLVTIVGNHIAERVTAQAGTHMRTHCKADRRAVKTIQNRSEIQFSIRAFDLRYITDVLHSGLRRRKIPPSQIIAL